jgi:hypothetical protein
VDEWVDGIHDVTAQMHAVRDLVRAGELDAAMARLPAERPLAIPRTTAQRIGAANAPAP